MASGLRVSEWKLSLRAALSSRRRRVAPDHRACIRDTIIVEVSVAATPLTCQIGIEYWRRDTNWPSRSAEEIAHVIGQFVQVVGYVGAWGDELWCEDLVQEDEIVGWAGGAEECVMGLQEEVPVAGFGDAFVDDAGGGMGLAMLGRSGA